MAFGILNVSGGTGGSGGASSEDIEAHNNDANAHPAIQEVLSDLKSRVVAVEVASGVEVTANPFAVTFGNLDGVTANGIWNSASARLEF